MGGAWNLDYRECHISPGLPTCRLSCDRNKLLFCLSPCYSGSVTHRQSYQSLMHTLRPRAERLDSGLEGPSGSPIGPSLGQFSGLCGSQLLTQPLCSGLHTLISHRTKLFLTQQKPQSHASIATVFYNLHISTLQVPFPPTVSHPPDVLWLLQGSCREEKA